MVSGSVKSPIRNYLGALWGSIKLEAPLNLWKALRDGGDEIQKTIEPKWTTEEDMWKKRGGEWWVFKLSLKVKR